jgi:hypothetical protein
LHRACEQVDFYRNSLLSGHLPAMPKQPVANPIKPGRLLLLSVALFAATRIFVLVFLEPQMSDVGEVYFDYAARAIDFQQTPYQGELAIEYPPLGWWTIAAPRLANPARITNPRDPLQIGPIYQLYRTTFRSLMFLFDLASFLLMLLVVQKRRPAWIGWASLIYTLATALLGPMLYDRLDTGLLMLFLLWAYCWVRSLDVPQIRRRSSGPDAPKPDPIRWMIAAYVALGLGISFKLIPILCVPFLLLTEWWTPDWRKRLAVAIVSLFSAAALPFAIQYAVSGMGVFSIFSYHGQRGIQIESLFASLLTVAALFGPKISIVHSHGAYELSGPLAPAMKLLSPLALLGFLIVTGLWALIQKSRFTRDAGYRLTCFVPAAAVILASVLSPQYFIWALPLLILVAVEMLPDMKWPRWIFGAALAATAALTTWVFPYHYIQTPESPIGLLPLGNAADAVPGAIASAVLCLRNTIYLATIVYLGARLLRSDNHLPA